MTVAVFCFIDSPLIPLIDHSYWQYPEECQKFQSIINLYSSCHNAGERPHPDGIISVREKGEIVSPANHRHNQ